MNILAWPARRNAERNPYQSLLYDSIEQGTDGRVMEFSAWALIKARHPTVLHLHWPDVFLAAGVGWRFWPRYAALRLLAGWAQVRRIPIIWTAHNIRREGQRNSQMMDRFFWPWFLYRVDGVIFMTATSASTARRSEPYLARTPYTVIPHGHYGPLISTEVCSTALIDSPLSAVFFGSISKYKNVSSLLAAFLDLPLGSAELVICGKMSQRSPDPTLVDLIASLSQRQKSTLSYRDEFLPQAQLIALIRGSDLVVFPYSDVLNSGAAIFALSAGRPILASDTPLFRELQHAVGGAWIRTFEGSLDTESLREALCWARRLRATGGMPDLTALDWSHIAQQTMSFYSRMLSEAKSGRNA